MLRTPHRCKSVLHSIRQDNTAEGINEMGGGGFCRIGMGVGGLTCRKKERETILLADRINWIWECAITNTNKSKLGRKGVLMVTESGYDTSLFI